MTALAEPHNQAPTLPGWSIVADLMPPEILAGRRAKAVSRLIVVALASVTVLCVLVYGLAVVHSTSSNDALKAETARTSQLQAKQRSYAGFITIKGKITAVQTQLAGLFRSDTDLTTLLMRVQAAKPSSAKLSDMSISIDETAATTNLDGGAASLDTSNIPHLGKLSLTGTAASTTDVAGYLDSLTKIAGVIQPYPGPITVDKKDVSFTIAMTLNTALLTHRFDVKNGQ